MAKREERERTKNAMRERRGKGESEGNWEKKWINKKRERK